MGSIKVTIKEQKILASLRRIAKSWPKELTLFDWSGNLQVMKRGDDGRLIPIESFPKINSGGGDPDSSIVNQEAEVDYE